MNNWRRALGVKQWGTPGSRRLLDATHEKAYKVTRGKKLSPAAVRLRRKRAKEMNLGRNLVPNQQARKWTDVEAALLGTMRDTELSRQLGLTRDVVKNERARRGTAAYRKPPHPETALPAAERERLRRQRIAKSRKEAWDRVKAS